MNHDFDQVELRDVSRHYGRRRAVSHVSLVARRGDILGLLGPNGAGKSTIIGMLATLVSPNSGAVLYGTRSAAENGPLVRGSIGLLAHELHLYPDLSARQNLRFFAELYGLDHGDVVPRALDASGLTERADDIVSSFSRGMRQRLALERSLMHGPRLVLFDEPFTGLDDRAVGIVSHRLRELAARGRHRHPGHPRPGPGGRPRLAAGGHPAGEARCGRSGRPGTSGAVPCGHEHAGLN